MLNKILALALLSAALAAAGSAAAAAPAALPEAPAPADVLGFEPGTDYRLADWDAILGYFRDLDGASDRVAVEVIGRSTLGKDMILAVITSEENLARQAEIRAAVRRLADPRGLTEAEALQLAAEIPAVVFVGCAQHATEIASTQAALRIAYDAAAEETAEMDQIRRDTILLLVPSMNPDGHQMVCDWYNEHVGTPFEGSSMPWLYHAYVGHDNNRDWAMITQAETRAISRVLYEEWFPQIVIDVHQMGNRGARMFIPPYYDPINPNIPPLHQHELALLSAQMHLDMSTAGHKGIISNAMFDEWLLGYFTSVPSRHNMVTQLIEMASVNVASPVFLRQRDLHSTSNLDQYGASANFPEPWEGGWWRLADIVAYEKTAIRSVLRLAAKNRDLFLQNFYRLGAGQIERGRTEPPFAFLIPPEQEDPATAWRMARALQRGGVEIVRARSAFTADNLSYPAGTLAVLMAQPYRAHAKDLLEKQVYPNLRSYPGGPPERPYDVTGWCYPLQMNVKTVAVVNPFEADLELFDRSDQPPPGAVVELEAAAKHILIERCQNDAFTLVNRLLAAGAAVRALAAESEAGGRSFEAGTFVIDRDGEDFGAPEMIRELGLRAYAVERLPEMAAGGGGAALFDVKPVRLGLYQPWTASMDEGWTRWVLEQYEFSYQTVHDAEIRAGGLAQRYDALILPDISPASIKRGHREGAAPKKYTGGIGEEGVFALRDFVREGGTLVALDSSCGLAIDILELPVRSTMERPEEDRYGGGSRPGSEGERATSFFCPGSILRIDVDDSHPLAFGCGASAAVLHANSPVFEEIKEKKKKAETRGAPAPEAVIIGAYPRMNPVMSGWIENDQAIHGKGALVHARCGDGAAVLIGFRCQFRAQTHGTFKVLFNAILGAESPPPAPAAPPKEEGDGKQNMEEDG